MSDKKEELKENKEKVVNNKPKDEKEKKFEPVKKEENKTSKDDKNKSKKIKKESKGITARVIAIIIILLVIVGLIYLAIPTPEKALNSMLQDLKNGNFEDVKKYVDYSELTSIPGSANDTQDGEIPQDQIEKEKLLYESLEWNIKSTSKTGDTATIEIEITNKDFKEIYKNYIQKVFEGLLSNSNLSDEEAEEYFIEQLKKEDISKSTTTQEITIEKQGGEWKVKVDDNLKNAIYPGMQEAMNSISDFITAE